MENNNSQDEGIFEREETAVAPEPQPDDEIWWEDAVHDREDSAISMDEENDDDIFFTQEDVFHR